MTRLTVGGAGHVGHAVVDGADETGVVADGLEGGLGQLSR